MGLCRKVKRLFVRGPRCSTDTQLCRAWVTAGPRHLHSPGEGTRHSPSRWHVCDLRCVPQPKILSPGTGPALPHQPWQWESTVGRAGNVPCHRETCRHLLCHRPPHAHVTWWLRSSISPGGILKLPGKTVPLQLSLCHCSSEGLKASVSTKGVGIGVPMVLGRTGDAAS